MTIKTKENDFPIIDHVNRTPCRHIKTSSHECPMCSMRISLSLPNRRHAAVELDNSSKK